MRMPLVRKSDISHLGIPLANGITKVSRHNSGVNLPPRILQEHMCVFNRCWTGPSPMSGDTSYEKKFRSHLFTSLKMESATDRSGANLSLMPFLVLPRQSNKS